MIRLVPPLFSIAGFGVAGAFALSNHPLWQAGVFGLGGQALAAAWWVVLSRSKRQRRLHGHSA